MRKSKRAGAHLTLALTLTLPQKLILIPPVTALES
jgi:hypothetical protein